MGELTRSADLRTATAEDLALFARAQDLQAHQRVPVLQHADNPHEYLFVALLDGTGQDANDADQLKTNVGHLYRQSEQLARDADNRFGFVYIEGIGAQDNPFVQWPDKIAALSWDDKIEKAYLKLAKQTRTWQEQDPDAQIRFVEVGYSRGAVLASGWRG